MPYPNFPLPTEIPAFLNPFDPSFNTSEVLASILGTVTTPIPQAGGAIVVSGPGGQWNPELAVFGWAFIGILPPASTGVSPPRNWPQIRGPGRAYWQTDPGGQPQD